MPIQILSLPVCKLAPADTPIITFLNPEVRAFAALAPTPTLFPSAPLVFSATLNASCPIAVLPSYVVPAPNAL